MALGLLLDAPILLCRLATISWVITLKSKEETLQDKFLRVDWLGGILFIDLSTALLIAIS
jgi:hypothetical protein